MMNPWLAAVVAYFVVGLIALEFAGPAAGLIGVAGAVVAYYVQKARVTV